MKVLVVTNDFPPRPGGIQQYLHGLATHLPAGEVAVYAPAWEGDRAFDAAQPFPVVRHPSSLMLPTSAVLKRAREVARAENADVVWFGASAPLGLLARPLEDDVRRFVGSTHGHEIGWGRIPVARQLLRRIARDLDAMTYLGQYTRVRLAPAVGDLTELVSMPSGVDVEAFHPDVPGDEIRRRHLLGSRPLVVCVSRLVPRKGQDMLIRALPAVQREVPGAALLVVGGGPDMPRLQRLAVESGVADDVRFTGSVPWPELPAHYAAADVFAMPCRSRLAGLDVEGLGIVFLEAAAAGKAVVAGNSGGAPDTVRHGETGLLVDGTSVDAVAAAVARLLGDPQLAAEMGRKGRAWVEEAWRWDVLGARMRALLAGEPGY